LAEIRWAAEQIPAEKMVAHIRSFYPDVQDRLTNERAVALAMWKAAIEGNVQAARELWERMYGKVKQEIEGTLGDNAAELLQRFADGLERADTDTTPVSP
jgi:acyl-CoA reductase-like NAD-dependent aldehyde dehydrogenase